MESIQIIKEKCKNYDYIINYNYKRNDIVTETIINTYQECIFSSNNKNELEKLDNIIMHYITNRKFYHYVQEYYNNDKKAYYENTKDKLIELYDKFDLDSLLNIKNTKWI